MLIFYNHLIGNFMSNMRTLNKKILIKEVEEEKSKSGILLSENAKTNYTLTKGEVIKKGQEIEDIMEGEHVYFAWGDKIRLGKEDYYLVDYENIALVI